MEMYTYGFNIHGIKLIKNAPINTSIAQFVASRRYSGSRPDEILISDHDIYAKT